MISEGYESAYQKGYSDAKRDFRKVRDKELSRDMEEIAEVINSDADAEAKCRMISDILTAKPHYFEET